MDWFIKKAIDEAKKSEHKHKIGCVIFKGKRLLASGFNEIRFTRKLLPKFSKWKNSLHAEQKAILFSGKKLNGASIAVVRIGKNGELRIARPCDLCMGLINYVGIKEVLYSDYDGKIITIRKTYDESWSF